MINPSEGNSITRCPLCWPDSVARRPFHLRGRPAFNLPSVEIATRSVLSEINRLNRNQWSHADSRVIISTNIQLRKDGLPYSNSPEPQDTGAAVYFTLDLTESGKRIARPVVLTCDKWNKVAYNLEAIARDIEAQRARLRWGCTNLAQAFRGYLAIPERCGGLSWWSVLGVRSDATKEQVREAFKIKAKTLHPDVGGNPAEWAKLKAAHDQAMGVGCD